MKTNQKNKIACWLILFLILIQVPVGALPEPSESFYVSDYANVLSPETEQKVLKMNTEMYRQTGVEMAVVTVRFLDGMNIENYAYQLFNSWEIGEQETNRGILLLMAIDEENYWVTTGTGISEKLTAQVLDQFLAEDLEPGFARGDYDEAVLSFYSRIQTFAGENWTAEASETDPQGSIVDTLITAAVMLMILWMILSALKSDRYFVSGRSPFRFIPWFPLWPRGRNWFNDFGSDSGFSGSSWGGNFRGPRGGGGGFTRGGGAGRR